jgi:hypothetical protein
MSGCRKAQHLLAADGFAVDASLIAADANKQRSVPSDEWKPEEVKDKACRAVREYLATLDDAAFGAASPVMPKFSRGPTRRPSGRGRTRAMPSLLMPPII